MKCKATHCAKWGKDREISFRIRTARSESALSLALGACGDRVKYPDKMSRRSGPTEAKDARPCLGKATKGLGHVLGMNTETLTHNQWLRFAASLRCPAVKYSAEKVLNHQQSAMHSGDAKKIWVLWDGRISCGWRGGGGAKIAELPLFLCIFCIFHDWFPHNRTTQTIVLRVLTTQLNRFAMKISRGAIRKHRFLLLSQTWDFRRHRWVPVPACNVHVYTHTTHGTHKCLRHRVL